MVVPTGRPISLANSPAPHARGKVAGNGNPLHRTLTAAPTARRMRLALYSSKLYVHLELFRAITQWALEVITRREREQCATAPMKPGVLAAGCQHGLHPVERSKLFCADDILVLIMVNRIIKFDVLRTPVTEPSGKLIPQTVW